MIKKFVTNLVLLFTILGSQPATAGIHTVQDMIGLCKGSDDMSYLCDGQASGVMIAMQINDKVPGAYRVCPKDMVSTGQAIRIFLNWAERNPRKWQIPSELGFVYSYLEVYPCR